MAQTNLTYEVYKTYSGSKQLIEHMASGGEIIANLKLVASNHFFANSHLFD